MKRLPINIAPKQALFIDGMSHAADIVFIAFPRLLKSLEQVNVGLEPSPGFITSCYSDAWACIDAIDRFLLLLNRYPKGGIIVRDEEIENFIQKMQPIRTIRNIGDHLPGQIDAMVSKNKSVMGELAWIKRIISNSEEKFLTFYIRPGYTGKNVKFQFLIPENRQSIEIPVGFVHLYACGKKANLSDAYISMMKIINHIDNILLGVYKKMGSTYCPMNRDIVGFAELNTIVK